MARRSRTTSCCPRPRSGRGVEGALAAPFPLAAFAPLAGRGEMRPASHRPLPPRPARAALAAPAIATRCCRASTRSERRAGGGVVLSREQLVRDVPGRAHPPQPRPRELGAARARAHARFAAAAGDGRTVARDLRAHHPVPRGHVLHDHDQRLARGGSFFVTAKDPAGPWSEPIWIAGHQGGIDPSLFFDDDGKVYLTSTGSPPGIYQSEIDVATGKLLTPAAALGVEGDGRPLPGGAAPLQDPAGATTC